MMLSWEVSQEESGMRLLPFLKKKMGEEYSTRALKYAIDHNQCRINQRIERFSTTTVGAGDHIILALKEQPLATSFDSSRILFEDDDLLAYNKPAGINSEDFQLTKELQLSYLELLHRLDRNTTGVLLFAKTEFAYQKMLGFFKNRLINKEYLAIIDRVPENERGTIDNYLGALHRYAGQTLWGAVNKSKGQHAVTTWQCEQIGSNTALLRCFPKTGRTHQIRVHLSEMGHPILGDHQYCKKFRCSYQPERYLLHAEKVSFAHPRTNKTVVISAPLPEDFIIAFKKLKFKI